MVRSLTMTQNIRRINTKNIGHISTKGIMFRCASFFAGVGGIDLGFGRAGFDVVYANEICEKASLTFNQNHEIELDTRDTVSYTHLTLPTR